VFDSFNIVQLTFLGVFRHRSIVMVEVIFLQSLQFYKVAILLWVWCTQLYMHQVFLMFADRNWSVMTNYGLNIGDKISSVHLGW